MDSIREYLFNKDVGESLKVNFLAKLCDGSTDIRVTEKKVVCVSYRDSVTFQPTLKFFNAETPKDHQDSARLKEVTKDSFKKHNLESDLDKIVFFASDGTSVNSGKNSGLIQLFQEYYILYGVLIID